MICTVRTDPPKCIKFYRGALQACKAWTTEGIRGRPSVTMYKREQRALSIVRKMWNFGSRKSDICWETWQQSLMIAAFNAIRHDDNCYRVVIISLS